MRDDNITSRIKRLEREVFEYRSRQVRGGDSLLVYDTFSDDAYDFNTIIPVSTTEYYEVEFTPTYPKTYTIIDMSYFFRLDDPDVMDAPEEAGPMTNIFFTMVKLKPFDTVKWQLGIRNVSGFDTKDIYMKFYFTGTDSGTWTVTSM